MITTPTTVLEGGYIVDWLTAIERYAGQRGLTVGREDDAIRLDGPSLDGHVLVALGRVAKITGSAGGADAVGDDAGAPAKRGLLGRLRRR